ncbi:MAG: hypothetical protein PVH19_06980 [Planctomycetia bacterium]|jgi:hypothetical protein
MASPFHVFRKNQKAMIATLGLLAIGAFVFLTPIAMYYSGRGPEGGPENKNPVVVTTTQYGDLTARDIVSLQREQQALLNVFTDLIASSSGEMASFRMQLAKVFFGDTSEEAVVNDWLLTKRAKELGMEVSDATILAFVENICGDKIKAGLSREVLPKYGLSEDMFFELLRRKLMGKKMLNDSFCLSFLPSRGGLFHIPFLPLRDNPIYFQGTPGQRWDYFQRLKREVELQVSPVKVADYIDEAPEPTEKEIKEFFEKYKNQPYIQGSPEPGFRVPEMANIEYIKVELDKFTDPDSVTKEEVEEYYYKNREKFQKFELPGLSEGANPEAGEQPEKPAENNAEKTTEPSGKEDKKENKDNKDDKTSDAARASSFRLVSMQTDDKATEEADKDKDAKTKPEGDTSPAVGAGDNPSVLGAGMKNEDELFKPLEEVENKIRHDIARDKARERMRKSLELARDKIKAYEVDRAIDGDMPPFDVKKLAGENDKWNYGKTDLLSKMELFETEIGKSTPDRVYQLVAAIAIDGLHDHHLNFSEDKDRKNVYLFWKIEQTEKKVPKLEDPGVREKVIVAFKEIKAREAAKEEAERLAEEARKKGGSLRKALIGLPVQSTDFFTWFEQPSLVSATGQPSIRMKTEVKNVGPVDGEFMETVYELDLKEIAVTTNFSKDTIYVTQLVASTPDEATLWIFFREEPYQNYARISGYDFYQLDQAWFNKLKEDAGLEWKREPEVLQRRGR